MKPLLIALMALALLGVPTALTAAPDPEVYDPAIHDPNDYQNEVPIDSDGIPTQDYRLWYEQTYGTPLPGYDWIKPINSLGVPPPAPSVYDDISHLPEPAEESY
jgi:hypothetical protein